MFFCFVGGHSTFFALLNTFVHIVMYFYYMVSAMGPKYQKYIWWKKYLTSFQMVCISYLSIYDITDYNIKSYSIFVCIVLNVNTIIKLPLALTTVYPMRKSNFSFLLWIPNLIIYTFLFNLVRLYNRNIVWFLFWISLL